MGPLGGPSLRRVQPLNLTPVNGRQQPASDARQAHRWTVTRRQFMPNGRCQPSLSHLAAGEGKGLSTRPAPIGAALGDGTAEACQSVGRRDRLRSTRRLHDERLHDEPASHLLDPSPTRQRNSYKGRWVDYIRRHLPTRATPLRPSSALRGCRGPGSQVAKPKRRHRVLVWSLVVLASVLLTVSITANWVQRELLDTDQVVNTTDEILDDEDVQEALSTYTVDQLFANVDVQGQFEERLPSSAQALAAPVAAATRQLAVDAAGALARLAFRISSPAASVGRTNDSSG